MKTRDRISAYANPYRWIDLWGYAVFGDLTLGGLVYGLQPEESNFQNFNIPSSNMLLWRYLEVTGGQMELDTSDPLYKRPGTPVSELREGLNQLDVTKENAHRHTLQVVKTDEQGARNEALKHLGQGFQQELEKNEVLSRRFDERFKGVQRGDLVLLSDFMMIARLMTAQRLAKTNAPNDQAYYATAEAALDSKNPAAIGAAFALYGLNVAVIKPIASNFHVATDPLAPPDDRLKAGATFAVDMALLAGPMVYKGARNSGRLGVATKRLANKLPKRLVRVVDARFANSPTLAGPNANDVFVAAADDISGITTSHELANRLTLLDNAGNIRQGPFAVIEFDTPASGVASPVFRNNPGFVQGGLTGGGAREFVLPNLQVKQLSNVTIKIIP